MGAMLQVKLPHAARRGAWRRQPPQASQYLDMMQELCFKDRTRKRADSAKVMGRDWAGKDATGALNKKYVARR